MGWRARAAAAGDIWEAAPTIQTNQCRPVIWQCRWLQYIYWDVYNMMTRMKDFWARISLGPGQAVIYGIRLKVWLASVKCESRRSQVALPRADFHSPQLPTFSHNCFPPIFTFTFPFVLLPFSHLLWSHNHLPGRLLPLPCSLFKVPLCLHLDNFTFVQEWWRFPHPTNSTRVSCSPLSGVTRLPGVRAWVFLDKQGAGYKFGGVATYRRCTNIPRQEMSCQGALGIERGGGVSCCHSEVNSAGQQSWRLEGCGSKDGCSCQGAMVAVTDETGWGMHWHFVLLPNAFL